MLCWRRFHLLWRFQAAFAGLLTFPCLGYVWAALRVVWVGAPRVGVFGWFPFTCGWAVISALCAARERAPPGVWLPGVVALVAYAVSGCPVTVLDVGAVTGFPCVCVWCCSPGGCAPCLVHGVWLRVLFRVGCFTALVAVCPLRMFVCRLCPVASRVACLLWFVLFVGYCVMCVS